MVISCLRTYFENNSTYVFSLALPIRQGVISDHEWSQECVELETTRRERSEMGMQRVHAAYKWPPRGCVQRLMPISLLPIGCVCKCILRLCFAICCKKRKRGPMYTLIVELLAKRH